MAKHNKSIAGNGLFSPYTSLICATVFSLLCLDPAIARQTVSDSNAVAAPLKSAESLLTRFQLQAPKSDWASLLEEHVAVLASSADPQVATPSLLRKLNKEISAILSTEGYFSPQIQFSKPDASRSDESIISIQVEAGPRTIIKDVSINFTGALMDAANAGSPDAMQRRDRLVKNWGLQQGAPFREADWSRSKTTLLESLRSQLYAGATLLDSRASIDPENHTASLELDLDSGVPYIFGELIVSGLDRYPLWLIDRFNPPKQGEPYSAMQLTEFQRALQNSAYFSTVAFNIDTDVTKADALPIEISLTERQARELSFGMGYSGNTGFRAEVSYRDRNFLDRVWDLRSAVRLEQKRQLSYAEIYLPPSEHHSVDSFGVLFDRLDAGGLLETRSAFGVNRVMTRGKLEQRLGASYTQDRIRESNPNQVGGGSNNGQKSKALVGNIGWTWRSVDDVFAPRDGHRMQLDFSVSDKALVSDQRFLRVYGKYQHWMPIGQQDSLILRAEIGRIFFSEGSMGIPNEMLFRTGGSNSVRGYAYQSLGRRAGSAVFGTKLVGVMSAEYVHWTKPDVGVAAFVDAGDAADSWRDFRAKQGIGLGGRLKTPAGPLAVDFAYGRHTKKVRFDFSIAIAF